MRYLAALGLLFASCLLGNTESESIYKKATKKIQKEGKVLDLDLGPLVCPKNVICKYMSLHDEQGVTYAYAFSGDLDNDGYLDLEILLALPAIDNPKLVRRFIDFRSDGSVDDAKPTNDQEDQINYEGLVKAFLALELKEKI